MADFKIDENDRNIVPADEIDHTNVVRYEPRIKPDVPICAEPVRSFSINEEWAKHIFGAIQTLTLWTAWIGEQDERNEAVQEIMEWLTNSCGDVAMPTIFRDNPLDLCEVQYSIDGGVSWVTMFRKDVCTPKASPTIVTNIYNDIDEINNNNTTWNNNIINIAPQWEYVDLDSDKALCWAIDFYVDMVCDVAINQIKSGNADRRDDNDWLEDVSNALTAGVIATIALLPTAPISMPVAALTALAWASTTIVQAAWDWIVTDDYSMYEDTEARQIIKCAMYQEMEGDTPQWELWRDSLSYHSSFGGNASRIAGLVHKWNQNIDIYINYMLLMEDINSIADTLPECPCDPRWSHFWDFTTVGSVDWRIGDYGEFQEGIGMVAQLRFLDGWYSMLISDLEFGAEIAELVPRCDGFQFHMELVRGTWDSNATALYMLQEPSAPHSANSGFAQTGNPGWRHNFTLTDVDLARISTLRSCFTAAGVYGSVVITGITFHGVGVDPFYGRVTA